MASDTEGRITRGAITSLEWHDKRECPECQKETEPVEQSDADAFITEVAYFCEDCKVDWWRYEVLGSEPREVLS